MPMTLGYWNVRGLTHPIRLLLEYTDSSYEEKRYVMGDAPNFDRSQWLSEKFNLGLDIPNLPYLIDGSHKITQSNAILRYLGRKHNRCPVCAAGGETEQERIRVDTLENQVMDTRIHLMIVCCNPEFVKQKPEFLKAIPDKMKIFSEFLGKRPWFAGDKITYVDFLAYDILDQYRLFEPTCLDAFPNLKDFLARFEGLKKISAYMKSSRFPPKTVFTKMAQWGYRLGPCQPLPCWQPTGRICPHWDPPGLGTAGLLHFCLTVPISFSFPQGFAAACPSQGPCVVILPLPSPRGPFFTYAPTDKQSSSVI
ncbi:LOW QUALITY PROTEIN: glutathione S-transferase Mu 3-like [Arvicola amphibius]|uniref:LOW QUALITY PROTEIN: glutathione S-transferase Mu 3-like n=1 Tax=Arvicola amphibius TaxID=1047088 RepID=UPI0018E3BD06|nr:LOW QUALITY PROTEIN: glutathione S-transferase Mu 3-like [Arvicola amphibius]